jgi:hypothetical protein
MVRETTDAVDALLERHRLVGAELQVELREVPATTHPLSGTEIASPPLAVLWQREVPVAVLVHGVLAVCRTGQRLLRERLVAEARARNLAIIFLRERRLWVLLGGRSARLEGERPAG